MIFFNKKRKEREEHGPLSPGWLNQVLQRDSREAARGRIGFERRQGLLAHLHPPAQLQDRRRTWGMKSGIVEFLMGHNKGMAWTYDIRDQLHPSDFEQECASSSKLNVGIL